MCRWSALGLITTLPRKAPLRDDSGLGTVRLSLAIARRILRRELSIDPDALLGLIKAGLEKIESAETHRVRVHPEHAAALKKQLDGAARPIAVVADPTLAVGAVIFETSRGVVDAGLETQLAEQGRPIPMRPTPQHAITPTDRRH